LSEDDTPTEAVINDVLTGIGLLKPPEIIVLLQPTSPVRTGKQIDEAITKLIETGADSLLSVTKDHTFIWQDNGLRQLRARPLNYPITARPRRQEVVQYAENGSIYVFTRKHWEQRHNRLGGRIELYEMPEECAIQIDTPFDLFLAEKILERNQYR